MSEDVTIYFARTPKAVGILVEYRDESTLSDPQVHVEAYAATREEVEDTPQGHFVSMAQRLEDDPWHVNLAMHVCGWVEGAVWKRDQVTPPLFPEHGEGLDKHKVNPFQMVVDLRGWRKLVKYMTTHTQAPGLSKKMKDFEKVLSHALSVQQPQ